MAYIFAADSMGLSSSNFCGGLRKTHLLWKRMRIGRSRSSKVIDFGSNRKGVCDFLLVVNSNFGPILHRFWDTASYWLKIANFPYPLSFNALARGEPFRISGWIFFIPKTRLLGLSVDEDFVILACVVFTQYQRVTDGQTDIPTMASTGLAAMLTPCKNSRRTCAKTM